MHYLAINEDFSNVDDSLENFFNNDSFRNEILFNSKELFENIKIEKKYQEIISDINL